MNTRVAGFLQAWRVGDLLYLVGALVALAACGKHPAKEVGDGGVDASPNADASPDARPDAGPVSFRDAGPPVAAPPQWAMLGADPQRTGQGNLVGPRRGAIRAVELAAQGRVFVEAIGPAGHVYVWLQTDQDAGQVVALAPDGDPLWRFPEATGPELGMACPGAALTPDGTLIARGYLDATTLEPMPAPDPAPSEMALLFELGLDGAPGWAWLTDPPEAGSTDDSHAAVVYDALGNFYAVLGPFEDGTGGTDRRLYAFGVDGTLRWVWDRDVGHARLPLALTTEGEVRVLKSGTSDIPAADEGLYSLYPDTGAERWFNPLGGFRMEHVSVGFAGRTTVTGFDHSGPAILDIDSEGQSFGSAGWNPDNTDTLTTPVLHRHDGTTCIGLSRIAHAYDSLPSGEVWCWGKGSFYGTFIQTDGDPCGALAVDSEDVLYEVTVGNGAPPAVHAVAQNGDDPEGVVLFTVDLPGAPTDLECDAVSHLGFQYAPALGDGRLYVGSPNGRLYIVE